METSAAESVDTKVMSAVSSQDCTAFPEAAFRISHGGPIGEGQEVCRGLWGTDSLNADPFNVRAEELALQDCAMGVEVRRTWTEQEMTRSFGGQMSPGTPDGMFESWDGDLTCVQVVRVPLVADADVRSMEDTLAQTVLTKVIKSQSWLRFTQAMPRDFIIFCWLPFRVPEAVAAHATNLMERVRMIDHRFSLRLRTPAEPNAIFPALFATNHEARVKSRSRSLTESDVTNYEECLSQDSSDDPMDWDITWGWDDDLVESLGSLESRSVEVYAFGTNGAQRSLQLSSVSVDEDDDFVCEWNITWDDNG